MINKIFFTFLSVALAIGLCLPATAQQVDDAEALKEYSESKIESVQIEILKTLGENMIQRRLNALSYAQNLLAQARLVAEDVKEEVGEMLEQDEAGLSKLKDEIESETSLDALKNKVQSIINDFRIYIVELPKAHGLAVVSHYRSMSDKLDGLADKISEFAGEADVDVSEIDKLVDEAKKVLSSAENNLDEAENKFNEMDIQWPTRATTLNLEGRGKIIDAKGELNEAFAKLKQAAAEIKSAIADDEGE